MHQGNGTAAILKNDPTVFTFSIHGKNNFPLHKESGDLDIALPDGAGDRLYLEALERGLDRAVSAAAAQLVIYLAGADPFQKDRFGRMSLTKEGLERRDRLVFQHCHAAGLPVAVTMAGGYAREVQDTVDIHFQTLLAALESPTKPKKPKPKGRSAFLDSAPKRSTRQAAAARAVPARLPAGARPTKATWAAASRLA